MVDEGGEDPRGTSSLILRLVANALRYRLAPIAETKTLGNLRHDADLLPRIRQQVIYLLDGFHRDSQLTYDIQGLRDEGTDILVRLNGPDRTTRFICFQIKSHIELAEDVVANKLLLQYSSSQDAFEPLAYFIVLAANMKDRRRQRVVRAIQSTFKKKSGVIIVDPQYTATFLRLQRQQMDALLTDVFRTGDPVITDARAELLGLYASEAALALTVGAYVVEHGHWPTKEELRQTDWFARVLGGLARNEHEEGYEEEYGDEDEDEEAVAESLASTLRNLAPYADGATFETQLARLLDSTEEFELGSDGTIRLLLNEHQALYCLMCEAVVKYGLDREELVNYILDLLLPTESANPSQ